MGNFVESSEMRQKPCVSKCEWKCIDETEYLWDNGCEINKEVLISISNVNSLNVRAPSLTLTRASPYVNKGESMGYG